MIIYNHIHIQGKYHYFGQVSNYLMIGFSKYKHFNYLKLHWVDKLNISIYQHLINNIYKVDHILLSL